MTCEAVNSAIVDGIPEDEPPALSSTILPLLSNAIVRLLLPATRRRTMFADHTSVPVPAVDVTNCCLNRRRVSVSDFV